MTATSAVLAGRAAAEAVMQDACTITRGTPVKTFDPATGEYVIAPGVSVYAGPCRVKAQNNADRVVETGAQAVSLFPYTVSVPVSAVVFEVDDTVTVTASALDPALVGLALRARQVAAGTYLTARRLGCEVAES